MNDSVRLPFFPVSEKGETLYSAVCRCSERVGLSTGDLLRRLTGQAHTTTLLAALPGHLNTFSQAMPNGHPWQDTNTLIRHHTALPYFTYFHSQAQRQASHKLLADAESSHPVAMGLSLAQYKVPASPRSPRFCVACAREQSKDLGFSYFQIAHQLPGVTHCWHHGEVLSDGCTTCGPYPLNGKRLTMPRQCLCNTFEPRRPYGDSVNPESAIWFARQSAYLLDSKKGPDDCKQRLRQAINQAGVIRGSHIDSRLLGEAIETRFGRDFLAKLNYPVWNNNGKPNQWIQRYLIKSAANKRLPTIPGLLILGSVFESVKSFESGRVSVQQYTDSELSSDEPSASVQSFTFSRSVSTTADWEVNLKATLAQHQYQIHACARTLGQSHWAIAKAAKQQGITIPLVPSIHQRIGEARLNEVRSQLKQGVEKKTILRANAISTWILQLIELDDVHLTDQHRNAAFNRLREKHRTRAISFLETHPHATRRAFEAELPGTYHYMMHRDKTWFFKKVPAVPLNKRGRQPGRAIIDWQQVDAALAQAVLITGKNMLTGHTRPRHVTMTSLLSPHQSPKKIYYKPDRFPLTQQAIASLVETEEQYLERRIRWVVQRLTATDRKISLGALQIETAIGWSRLKKHQYLVNRVIDESGATDLIRGKLKLTTREIS